MRTISGFVEEAVRLVTSDDTPDSRLSLGALFEEAQAQAVELAGLEQPGGPEHVARICCAECKGEIITAVETYRTICNDCHKALKEEYDLKGTTLGGLEAIRKQAAHGNPLSGADAQELEVALTEADTERHELKIKLQTEASHTREYMEKLNKLRGALALFHRVAGEI